MNIPFVKPQADIAIDNVTKVLRTAWLSVGEELQELEEQFADYIGTDYAVAVNSGTSALELAILATTQPGDKILVPSFTFVASANAIVNTGRIPVFVDINPDTGTIDFEKDASYIDNLIEKEDITAIMPVHFAGVPCPGLDTFIESHPSISVIEDSCECIGGKIGTTKTGALGVVGCFSFTVSKQLTCGEGGMITTNDEQIYTLLNMLRSHGVAFTGDTIAKKDCVLKGHNYRMSNISASILLPQLKYVKEWNSQREKHAKYLSQQINKHVPGAKPLACNIPGRVYQMYSIVLDGLTRKERDQLVVSLRKKGVEAMVYFDPPVHRQTAYRGRDLQCKQHLQTYTLQSLCPNIQQTKPYASTDKLCENILQLPLYPQLTTKEMDYMVLALQEVRE
jgi:dTDP-4-amino-4,6-dideoxygalactose transaminase